MASYFDHNATTVLAPQVLDAMLPALRGGYGNPSSVHRFGRAARDQLERARARIAEHLGCLATELVFVSGGSEANNLALQGWASANRVARVSRSLLYGATEHPAVLETAEALGRSGVPVSAIPVDRNGLVDWVWLERYCEAHPTGLISLMRVNNETGVIQDLAPAVRLARRHGAWLHVDAVQALGKLPLDFKQLDCDLMSVSAHKIRGPKGIGALIVRSGLDLPGLIHGGGQERGLRGGTENLAAIVGFAAAVELAAAQRQAWQAHVVALQQQLTEGLMQIPGAVIHGEAAQRVANTVQFSLPGYDGEALLMMLDRKGFAVSSGSACASGRGEPSHVLLAMGVEEALARAAVRVSFGVDNSADEVEGLLRMLSELSQGAPVPA